MLSDATTDAATTAPRRRRIGVVASLLVGCLLAATAAVAVWARTTALDTDSYVAAVAPLPEDPAVSAALAHNVVDMVLGEGYVEQQLRQRLPEDITFLAAPIASSVRDVAIDSAERFVSSDGFLSAWETINRSAHPKAVQVLTGRSAITVNDDGKVTVDLTELAGALRTRLEDTGLGNILPPSRDQAVELVLFEVADHGFLQLTVDLLDMLYWVLPLLAVAAIAAAIWLSEDRRRTWLLVGIGLVVSMAISLLLVNVARGVIVGEILNPVNQAAIAAIWDQVVGGLARRQVALMTVAAVVAATAFAAGPHRWAVSLRSGLRILASTNASGAEAT